MDNNRVIYTTPYDSEVEYLESTRTQKINTGYYADSSITSFELNIGFSGKFNASGGKVFISSSDNGEPYKSFSMNFGSTSSEHHKIFNWFGIRYESGGKQKSYVVTFSDINKITYSNGTATFNNSTIRTEVTSGRRQLPLMILGTPNTTFSAYTARLYSFKITEGDSLILNLIPVRVGNIGYMYDKVSGKLFGNQGTGNFILGQDVANPVPNIRRVFKFENKRFVMPMPYDSKIEYLESSGTQWINTDTIVNSLDSISVTLQFTQPNTPVCIWSARNIPIKNTISLFRINNSLRFDYGETQVSQNASGVNFSIKHEYKSVANKLYVDDVLKATNTAASFTTNKSVMVLASRHANTNLVSNFAYAKLYSVKIINSNNEVLRDLIPVRRGNVGYMYDKVSGKLFGNAGTRQFILGNDIN